jgi:hypothetical protein
MTTTAPVYIARVTYDITDMCEGRAVGALFRDVNVRLSENTEACARKAFADSLEGVAWANLSTYKSYRVIKTIK